MTMLRLLTAVTMLIAATSAHAKTRSPSVDDDLQAACYPDVQRLCKDAIPDEGKIRACMEGKKAMVSAKCTTAYKKSQG